MSQCLQLAFGFSPSSLFQVSILRRQTQCVWQFSELARTHCTFLLDLFLLPPFGIICILSVSEWLVTLNLEMTSLIIISSPTPIPRPLQMSCCYSYGFLNLPVFLAYIKRAFLFVCMCVHMCAYVRVCVQCSYICACLCVYVHVCTRVNGYVCAHGCACKQRSEDNLEYCSFRKSLSGHGTLPCRLGYLTCKHLRICQSRSPI